jgi:hypothetical protein
MPVVKIKYLGSGETGLTNNANYTVLSFFWSGGVTRALILDDAGHLYVTAEDVTNTAKWQFVSAQVVSSTTVAALTLTNA